MPQRMRAKVEYSCFCLQAPQKDRKARRRETAKLAIHAAPLRRENEVGVRAILGKKPFQSFDLIRGQRVNVRPRPIRRPLLPAKDDDILAAPIDMRPTERHKLDRAQAMAEAKDMEYHLDKIGLDDAGLGN